METWHKGRVIRIADETAETKRFWIELPGLKKFDFIPGQYVTVDLPIHEHAHKRNRSYSIASWPDDTNIFELVIVINKNGDGTAYFFEEIKVGSELMFQGPHGSFILTEPLEENIFMICTGTGITPFRSMLHHINNNGIPHQNIYLIAGSRSKAMLLFHDEMLALQKELSGFHYIPTLSQEEWEGKTGYVHTVYESLLADRKPASFFLSGWRDMINDAKKIIMDMGYDKIIMQ